MEALQRKNGTKKSMMGYNPAALAARSTASSGRRLPSGLAQTIALDRQTKDQQDMDDEENIPSARYRSVQGSSRAGGAGPSREGGGGGRASAPSAKGKERERAQPAGSSPAKGQSTRSKVDKIESPRKQARRKLATSTADLGDLSDSSDDDLPDIGKAGKRSPRRQTTKPSPKKSARTPPEVLETSKKKRRFSTSEDDGDRPGSRHPTSSPSRRSTTPPLPNFKKKNDRSVPHKDFHNMPSPDRGRIADRQPPKPKLYAPLSASSSAPTIRHVYDLEDSPERPASKLTRSPTPPFQARRPTSNASPSSSRRDRIETEEDLTPRKKPGSRPKPNAKLKAVQSTAAPTGVTNPIAVRRDRSSPPAECLYGPPLVSGALQPVKATPKPFPGLAKEASSTAKEKSLTARASKPTRLQVRPEQMDAASTPKVQFQAKPRQAIRLTDAELEERRLATRQSVSQGTDADSSSSEEEAAPASTGVPSSMNRKSKKKTKPSVWDGLKGYDRLLEQSRQAKLQKKKNEELFGTDEVSLDTDRPHKNPRSLCIFCSEPLPATPSAKLVSLIARLRPLAHPAPTTYNKYAVSLPMILSINVCTLHRSETSHLPAAVAKGWPTEIDWVDVRRRIRDPEMIKELNKVVYAKEASVFFGFAKEQAEKLGSMLARTAKGQYEVATKSQPGYYGEIGQILFHQVLCSVYLPPKPDKVPPGQPVLTPALTAPLTPSDFAFFVLVPEVAVRLIQQDLGLPRSVDAFEVLMDSRAYGNSRFAAEEGEAAGGALMHGWDEQVATTQDSQANTIVDDRRSQMASSSPLAASSSVIKPKKKTTASSSIMSGPAPFNLAPIFARTTLKHVPEPGPSSKRPLSGGKPPTAVKRKAATTPIVDLDSDDAKENMDTSPKVDRDKTLTPPAHTKAKKQKGPSAYVEIDSVREENVESQGRSSPAGGAEGKMAKGVKPTALQRSHSSMQRTESERVYWPSSDSFDLAEFDPDSVAAGSAPHPKGMPNITAASMFDEDDNTF